MPSQGSDSLGARAEPWIGLAVCAAVVLGWAWEQLVPNPDGPQAFAPDWLPLAAAGVAVAGIMPLVGSSRWLRVQRALRWTGLLLMVWSANGLPFDLLTAAGLMGHRTASGAIVLSSVYWPGLATRALALAAVVVLARLALARPAAPASTRAATWYAYAAFLLALPYPVLRTHWALGGTLGLESPGAAGEGWEPLLIAHPVGAGGRSLAAPGFTAELDAAPAVAGRRLVRHHHRRHDRAGGPLVGGQRLAGWRRYRQRGHRDLGVRSLLRQLVPVRHSRRCRHPLISIAWSSAADVLAGVTDVPSR